MHKQIVPQLWRLIGLFTLSTLLWVNPAFSQSDQFDGMRQHWITFLTGQNADTDPDVKQQLETQNAEVTRYLKTMVADSTNQTFFWKDFKYTYSKDITSTYRRLFVMALAYKNPYGKLYQNQQLKKAVLGGLKWLQTYHYNQDLPLPVPAEGSDIHNWWDYKIGVPLQLNNIVLLLYNELTEKERQAYMRDVDHFTPDWTDRYTRKPATTQFTAANRVWVSMVIGLRGLILKDAKRLKAASDSLAPVFKEAVTGDGFYADGSFIQHVKHPYTGGYGVSLLNNLAEEVYFFSGTQWAVDPKGVQQIYHWLENAFAPVIFRGNMMSMVQGREISRPDAQGDRKGGLVIQSIALLAKAAPTAEKARLNGLLKHWFANRLLRADFYSHIAGNYIPIVKELLTSKQPALLPEINMYRQFAHMDRAVQQTANYAFGISMYSARIYNYETRTNYENKKAWHTSDGQTYLYNADTEQFNDDFWATVNYFHLPGTTVIEGTKIPGFKTSRNHWVGGAAMLDRYGVSGMDLAPYGQKLTAKKSWFMLDGKIVALGAGIAPQSNDSINTYIEQRKLSAGNSNIFSVDGKTINADDSVAVFAKANWAHLSGTVPSAAIGYYFPAGMALQSKRAAQSGAWFDVNVNYSKKTLTHHYLTLWQNHAKQPAYAYVLLPGFSADATAAYAAKPDVQVLSNTAQVQAVRSESLHLIAANFWDENGGTVNDANQSTYLSCSGQAAVMVMQNADSLHIALADPTMRGGEIMVTINQQADKVITTDSRIKVLALQPALRLAVIGKQLDGSTANIIIALKKQFVKRK